MSQAPVFRSEGNRETGLKPLLPAGPRALSQHPQRRAKSPRGSRQSRGWGLQGRQLSQLGSSPVPQVATLATVFGGLVSKAWGQTEGGGGKGQRRKAVSLSGFPWDCGGPGGQGQSGCFPLVSRSASSGKSPARPHHLMFTNLSTTSLFFMAVLAYSTARSVWSSISTQVITSFPCCLVTTFSNLGPQISQGPHHCAWKSTTTGVSLLTAQS